jgi:hypothetical protein
VTSFGPTDVVLHLITPPYALDDTRLVKGEIYVGLAYGNWYIGPMTQQWYGWNWACGFGAGVQADHIDGPLYRFDPEQHISRLHVQPARVVLACAHCGEDTPGGLCGYCGVLNE